MFKALDEKHPLSTAKVHVYRFDAAMSVFQHGEVYTSTFNDAYMYSTCTCTQIKILCY